MYSTDDLERLVCYLFLDYEAIHFDAINTQIAWKMPQSYQPYSFNLVWKYNQILNNYLRYDQRFTPSVNVTEWESGEKLEIEVQATVNTFD